MSVPKNVLNKELGAITKDPAVYKNLTPEEQKIYDANTVMPAVTKKWVLEYVNIQLGDQQTFLDESLNSAVKEGADKILSRFGKHVGRKPYTDMVGRVSRQPIYGALGGINPRQINRNKFQLIQNMALYGIKATLRGLQPKSSYPIVDRLITDSLFKQSYTGFEELPVAIMGKIAKIGLAPYQWSAITNVNQTMKTAGHWTIGQIKDPAKKSLGWADPKRTYTEDKDFFYPSEIEKILKEMEYGAQTTQYQYIGMGMPEVFRYKALAPITRLQSWWMNHWFMFHREAATRAFTGHTGYDPNLKLSMGDRVNYFKYLIIGGAILTSMGYRRSYLMGTAPTGLPPTAQLMMGLYTYFTNQGGEGWAKRKRGEAKYRIKEALKIHAPGYLSIKDMTAFLSGDKALSEYLFYKKKKKTEDGGVISPPKITAPKIR